MTLEIEHEKQNAQVGGMKVWNGVAWVAYALFQASVITWRIDIKQGLGRAKKKRSFLEPKNNMINNGEMIVSDPCTRILMALILPVEL